MILASVCDGLKRTTRGECLKKRRNFSDDTGDNDETYNG
ncbi:hypothetical protein GKODMF_14165 [Candidatus Electrothrix gigas]